MTTYASNVHLREEARNALDDATWAYLTGGAGTEATLRRNRLAFESLALLPRVLRDVSNTSAAVEAFGTRLRIPVAMAPVGTLEAFHADGVEGVAEACGRFGALQVVGAVGTDPSAIAATGEGPKAYQLYPTGDTGWMRDVVDEVGASGFTAIVFTVDVASRARRERQELAGLEFPGKKPPDRDALARASWADVDRLREMTRLPLLIKGIQSPADATLAFDRGADGVWVSNHGGRQLDHGRPSLDSLVDVVAAVSGRGVIVFDGGVQTGSDVLKAMALGADLVAVGKLQCLALASGGTEGVSSMLEVLEDEILTQMGQLGVARLGDLTATMVCPSIPSGLPDPTDAWSALR